MSKWQEVIQLHGEAAKDYANAARSISPERWAASAEDCWGGAHVTEHLSRVYEILLLELNGQDGMQVRTKFWTRQMLRWILVPRLLMGAPFPKARAPRETRPVELRTTEQNHAVDAFEQLAGRFASEIEQCYEQNPEKKLTHAYFGSSDLEHALLLCARHIQHHTKKLRTA